jgi:hypothetical protein
MKKYSHINLRFPTFLTASLRTLLVCITVSSWIVTMAIKSSAQSRPAPYEPRKDQKRVPRQPYERYFTYDRFGREITFYLSEATDKTPLPLMVYIQGSGCGSLFKNQDDRVVPASGHITLQVAAQAKARALIVEKPGVKFLD